MRGLDVGGLTKLPEELDAKARYTRLEQEWRVDV